VSVELARLVSVMVVVRVTDQWQVSIELALLVSVMVVVRVTDQ